MSGSRFLDDFARTLAQPMPRRRAIRVLGVSLAAVAVPGFRPRMARSATLSSCGPDERICEWDHDDKYNTPVKEYCCGPSSHIQCGPVSGPGSGKCVNTCPSFNAGISRNQYPCIAEKPIAAVDDGGERATWKAGNCCIRPEYKGCFPDGTCKPNCPARGRGYFECGKECCPPGSECKQGTCAPCANTCAPPNGQPKCCPRGTRCCFNERTAACCGPNQTCNASTRGRAATCTCNKPTDTKCGSDCCGNGESCCNGKECCKSGETCLTDGCCPKGRAVCRSAGGTGGVCCAQGEYCLWKVEDELAPLAGTCKRGCSPGNRCGTQCCGTGYRCRRGMCKPI